MTIAIYIHTSSGPSPEIITLETICDGGIFKKEGEEEEEEKCLFL
jgi:hypothetical protein